MDKQNTTKIDVTDSHKRTLKVIEMAVYEAARRIREGKPILPSECDSQLAKKVVDYLLQDGGSSAPGNLFLVDIYLFTLAQATSNMLTLFEENTDSD